MPDSRSSRAAFTICGFVLGVSAAGFAISNAVVSFLVILERGIISDSGGGLALSLDWSSQISLVLSAGILILGLLLVRGSLMIWRLSIMGGAINLACGILLTALSYAMISVGSGLLASVYSLVYVEYILMGLMAMLSGVLGIVALFEQLQKRFVPASDEERDVIHVVVILPSGKKTRVGTTNDDTLKEFKDKIEQFEGTPVDSSSIIYRGRKVTDESMTIKELGVREGDKITLI